MDNKPKLNQKFVDLITEVEGNREDVYLDSMGNPTAGVGFNLQDPDMRSSMFSEGVDPDEVAGGTRSLQPEEISRIKQTYYTKREPLVKNAVGSDLYDLQDDNKRAALMSLGYQSLNNIGPNLRSYISQDDDIGAIREIILNTNKHKDPGTLVRRLKEAQVYNPEKFASAFQTFNDQEKKFVLDLLNQIKNEHTKKAVLEQYGNYLMGPPPKRFPALSNK